MDWLLNWRRENARQGGRRVSKTIECKEAGWDGNGTYILHDVEEAIVDIGMLCKLDLDLVQVGEGILDVESRL